MPTIIDNSFVEPYFRGGKRHTNYDKALDHYYHTSFHFDGFFRSAGGNDGPENPYFNRLIGEMRPNETPQFMDWRKANFIPENKIPCFKVLNILKKGVRSEDWKIDFSSSESHSKIKEDETLEDYTGGRYPYFNSLENWLYSFAIKKLIQDPNGVIVIMPRSYDYSATDYIEAYTYIIDSANVLDFKAQEYVVFISNRQCSYAHDGKRYYNGKVITIVTQNEIWDAEQSGLNSEFTLTLRLEHKIGRLPAFQLGGFVQKHSGDYTVYESFIASILPGLDKAAREMSDLDAEVIQHIHSTMWRMDGQDCPTCNGGGKVPGNGGQVTCSTCKGDGKYRKSPEKEIVIKSSALEPGNLPIPPAGYISKPTDIVKVQDERIKNHVINALSSIGMDYLIGSLAQSGISKQYDREEANNFVYAVYYHIVENILSPAYYFINEYRNREHVPGYSDRQKLLPKINIPQKFDIFSEGVVMAQIETAKKAGASSVIIDQLEIDLVSKYFYNDPIVRDKIVTIKTCDPLPGKTDLEKADLLLTKGISMEDFILSNYIASFVETAIEEDDDFLKKKRKEKIVILKKYAKDKMLEITPARPSNE